MQQSLLSRFRGEAQILVAKLSGAKPRKAQNAASSPNQKVRCDASLHPLIRDPGPSNRSRQAKALPEGQQPCPHPSPCTKNPLQTVDGPSRYGFPTSEGPCR